MATVSSILTDIATLTASEKEALKSRLVSLFTVRKSTINEFVGDERFSDGLVCPVCGYRHIVRNGHRKDGTQRYICRDCKSSFVAASNSIVSGSKLGFSVWEKYIECMLYGLSLRDSADKCGIHRNTAFTWRHKILGALQEMAGSVHLDGIIEAYETFFPISYKGNHSKGGFSLPRKPHKRGSMTHLRGLSREKVCVPCAVNRNGLSVSKATNVGRVATKDLHAAYDGKISGDSTIVTDLMNSYRRFANSNGLELVQLKGGRAKKGIYNIQHINSYHNELKLFMSTFKGVSSKHLNNYLIWHNFVNYAPECKVEKNILAKFTFTRTMIIKAADISKKPALPFVA